MSSRGNGTYIHSLKSDEDHETALREIEALWGAEEGTETGDRLDLLATLVEAYESRCWPLEPLDPVRAIKTVREKTATPVPNAPG